MILEYGDKRHITRLLRDRTNDYSRGIVIGWKKTDDRMIIDFSDDVDEVDMLQVYTTLRKFLYHNEESS